MKQVIYVDVLIVVNLIINYLLLLATSRFLYLKFKRIRLLIGEILGGVYSFYIFFPDSSLLVSLVIKLMMAISIVLAVFGYKNLRIFLKTLLCFYLMNFCFSGTMLALWHLVSPKGMALNNGIVYFNISPIVLIVSALAAYMITEFANRIFAQKENKKLIYEVCIKVGDGLAKFSARLDTCNLLMEPFSNLPVIVVSQECLKEILPKDFESTTDLVQESTLEKLKLKLRLVPFKTVSGEGMLPAFKPDDLIIKDSFHKEAYIAVCSKGILPQNTSALMNPLLVN